MQTLVAYRKQGFDLPSDNKMSSFLLFLHSHQHLTTFPLCVSPVGPQVTAFNVISASSFPLLSSGSFRLRQFLNWSQDRLERVASHAGIKPGTWVKVSPQLLFESSCLSHQAASALSGFLPFQFQSQVQHCVNVHETAEEDTNLIFNPIVHSVHFTGHLAGAKQQLSKTRWPPDHQTYRQMKEFPMFKSWL